MAAHLVATLLQLPWVITARQATARDARGWGEPASDQPAGTDDRGRAALPFQSAQRALVVLHDERLSVDLRRSV
ncbi:MAG: hypothetical protein ACRDTV_12525, partial [Mycobacterium sp.]